MGKFIFWHILLYGMDNSCQSVHKGYTNLRHLKQNKLQTSNIEHPKSSKILQTLQAKNTEKSVELICNILKVFIRNPIKNVCEDKKSRHKPPSAIRQNGCLCCSVCLLFQKMLENIYMKTLLKVKVKVYGNLDGRTINSFRLVLILFVFIIPKLNWIVSLSVAYFDIF